MPVGVLFIYLVSKTQTNCHSDLNEGKNQSVVGSLRRLTEEFNHYGDAC